MENQEYQKQNKGIPLVWELIIALAATVLCVYLAELTLVSVIVAAVPGAYLMAKRGYGWGLAMLAAGALACWAIGGAALAVFAAIVPLVLTVAVCVRRKVRAFTSMAAAAAAAMVGVGLLVGIVYLVSGKDVITYLVDLYAAEIAQSEDAAVLGYMLSRSGALSGELLTSEQFMELMTQISELGIEEIRAFATAEKQLAEIKTYLGGTVPTIVVSYGLYAAVVTYILGRVFVKISGREVAKMPPFSKFILPKQVSIYFVITYFLAIVPEIFGLEDFYLAGNILAAITGSILLLQGVSFVYYILEKLIRRKGVRIVLTLVAFIVLGQICMMLGLIEQIFRTRDKMEKRSV